MNTSKKSVPKYVKTTPATHKKVTYKKWDKIRKEGTATTNVDSSSGNYKDSTMLWFGWFKVFENRLKWWCITLIGQQKRANKLVLQLARRAKEFYKDLTTEEKAMLKEANNDGTLLKQGSWLWSQTARFAESISRVPQPTTSCTTTNKLIAKLLTQKAVKKENRVFI